MDEKKNTPGPLLVAATTGIGFLIGASRPGVGSAAAMGILWAVATLFAGVVGLAAFAAWGEFFLSKKDAEALAGSQGLSVKVGLTFVAGAVFVMWMILWNA